MRVRCPNALLWTAGSRKDRSFADEQIRPEAAASVRTRAERHPHEIQLIADQAPDAVAPPFDAIGDSVPPLKPEHLSLLGKALESPLAERHESRRILLAQLARESGHDDAVGLGFAA